MPKRSEPAERNAYGLREALFDLLDGLRDGTVKPREARVQCEVAAKIIDTVRAEQVELQVMRESLRLEAMTRMAQLGTGE